MVIPVAFAVLRVVPEIVTPELEADTVAPGLIPVPVIVTLADVPATIVVTVAGWRITMLWTKRAVTVRLAEAVTVQVVPLVAHVAVAAGTPFRAESPGPATFHPANTKPGAGTAAKLTVVLSSTTEVHVVPPLPQSMLPGFALTPPAAMSLLTTEPPALEAVPSTVSATVTGERFPPLARLVDSTVVDSSVPTKLAQLLGSPAISLHSAVWASS